MRPPLVLAVLALLVPLGGCAARTPAHAAPPTGSRSTVAAASPSHAATVAARAPLPSRPAPDGALPVRVRHLSLARGDRPLPTTVWYPQAAGRFPLVLFSHGLNGLPANLGAVGTRWAAAGFVVAAPAYPHTVQGAAHFDVRDVANQPADASYVISRVLALDDTAGDPLAGHLDTAAVAAAGHSAGGYTTTYLLAGHRDDRLRAAVVIAGALLGGPYTGPATPVLFVHGDADRTVSYTSGGRAAYDALPWPKAFLTVVGGDHGRYLAAGQPGFDQVVATTTDFLRWSLYGDQRAKDRLSGDGSVPGTSRWDSQL